MNDKNEGPACGVSFELSCANCGQVVSCERDDSDYIARDLIASDDLGFGALLAALVVAGWDIQIHQLVVGEYPRVIVMGTPVDRNGHTAINKHDVTAIWERRPEGWLAGTKTTGWQRIQGGALHPESAGELARLVAASPADWVRTTSAQ
ncbi:hypothetical protein [Nocardia sp. NPDC005366]|uniref:hypothetical protein n=1 Tax=Nocardia sp. NPDC005366 TaxID=3156878 RepID=UPI0033AB8859